MTHVLHESWRCWYKPDDLRQLRHRMIGSVSLHDRLVPASQLEVEAPAVADTLLSEFVDAGLGEQLSDYPIFRMEGGWYGVYFGTGGHCVYNIDGRTSAYDDMSPAELIESGFDRIVDDRVTSPDWDRWLIKYWTEGSPFPESCTFESAASIRETHPDLPDGWPDDDSLQFMCKLEPWKMVLGRRIASLETDEERAEREALAAELMAGTH
jgi:hypothetical protein